MTESRISPWIRPGVIATVTFASFGVAILSGVIDLFVPGAGLRFGGAVMAVMGRVPDGVLDLLGVVFGAYAIAKSTERATSTYATAKYDPPARPVDDPDKESS